MDTGAVISIVVASIVGLGIIVGAIYMYVSNTRKLDKYRKLWSDSIDREMLETMGYKIMKRESVPGLLAGKLKNGTWLDATLHDDSVDEDLRLKLYTDVQIDVSKVQGLDERKKLAKKHFKKVKVSKDGMVRCKNKWRAKNPTTVNDDIKAAYEIFLS